MTTPPQARTRARFRPDALRRSGARGSRSLRALAAACALGLTAACAPPIEAGDPARPNVVLLTLDTTRADHLGAYGYFRDTSPNFDRLSAESLLFEQFIAPMATTLPTHISLLTGAHPLEHGVLANSTQGGERFVPSPELRSFAEFSREQGYATAAFVSAAPLKRGSGAEIGFDHFDQPEDKARRGDATLDAALDWLAQQRRGPYLLWIHLYDPHHPFEAPGEFAGRFHTDAALERHIAERRIAPSAPRPLTGTVDDARESINRYDEEILFTDHQLGRLLEALRGRPDWPQTALLVMGDHGEGLCQHGLAAHGDTWDEQLHAPLLMHVPGVGPRRIATPLSASDVLPTLAALAHLPQSAALQRQASGRDLLAAEGRERPILSQDTGRERGADVPYRHALRFEGWKLYRVEHPDGRRSKQLFDLRSDPFELVDRAADEPERVASMSALLASEIATHEARGRALRGGATARTRTADPALRAELEALGYLEAAPAR